MKQFFIIILRRILLAVFGLFGIIRRILTCQWFRRNQQRIGELPTFISNKTDCSNENTEKGWSNWSDNPSVLTSDSSTQIEEYRRQMQANLLATKSARKKFISPQFGNNLNYGNAQKISLEPDLFDEIQPQVKAPKRLLIKQSQTEQQRNLFEMRDCDTPLNDLNEKPGELGQLVDDNFDNYKESNWLSDEDNINVEQLDSVEKEQQRREREIRKQQRQMEHVRQLEQKRLMERNK